VIPDIPTAIEAGYPSLEFDGLVACSVRAKWPPTRAIAWPTMSARSPRSRDRPEADTDRTGRQCRHGAEFAASIAQQREQVAAVAKLFGNKPIQ